MKSDVDLLRQFAEAKDEASFAALVEHHIGFVLAALVASAGTSSTME